MHRGVALGWVFPAFQAEETMVNRPMSDAEVKDLRPLRQSRRRANCG